MNTFFAYPLRSIFILVITIGLIVTPLTVVVAQEQTGGIRGGVYTADTQTPISPAILTIYGDDVFRFQEVEEDGTFEINDLPPGNYQLKIQSDGWGAIYYGGVNTPILVPVNSDEFTENINFYLSPGRDVSGRVTDLSGNPLQGMNVWAYLPDGMFKYDCTKEDGTYYIPDLGPGSYAITVRMDRNSIWCFTPYDYNFYYAEIPVVVDETDLPSTDFVLQPAGGIRGFVWDQQGYAISGGVVRAYDMNGELANERMIQDNGEYFIDLLNPGSYYLQVIPTSPYVRMYYPDVFSVSGATIITVETMETKSGYDFIVQTGGIITGILRNETGMPVVGRQIEVGVIIDGDVLIKTCSSPDDGTYQLDTLPMNLPMIIFAGGFDCGAYIPTVYWNETSDIRFAIPITLTSEFPFYSNVNLTVSPLAIQASPNPTTISTSVPVVASFIDPDQYKTHYAWWVWGDGTYDEVVAENENGTIKVRGYHNYTIPGIYTISLYLKGGDNRGYLVSEYQYIVIYDPNGGFVTGGGWINSPLGAYTPNPSLTGKATFGFVSKYQKGANIPTGNTEFQFHVAGMNFKSTSYDWLVITGTKAQYKGIGTINGLGEYKFILTAIDGSLDKFRIKIWDNEYVIYDNMLGAEDTADPTTVIQGGSIVIHKAK